MMTGPDAIYQRRFPQIPWLEPIEVSSTEGGPVRIGCRFCIARFGLRASEIDRLYETREAWAEHMAQFHAAQ